MSTSPRRRERLRVARSLPATRCPACGTLLERVAIVTVHIRRCDRRLAGEQARLEAAMAVAS
jgi:hypothetical protein